MESIRILQDTYELLYALSFPMGKYLDSHMPKLHPNWFQELFIANKEYKREFEGKTCASDLDIYFQTQLLNRYWEGLKRNFPNEYDFYKQKNKVLITDIQNIRNSTMHVDHSDITYNDFSKNRNKIREAAKLFDSTIEELIDNLHNEEKNKLLSIIKREVLEPAIDCQILNKDIKESVKDTLNRLSSKSSAREIHEFFKDALNAKKGKEVYAELKAFKLKGFEDIALLIEEAYYS